MLFLRPTYSWWFGLYSTKTRKMVDYQINLEAWLQEASLFRNEPVDNAINLEDLLSNEKANDVGNQDILGLPDLGWLDEKVNLAIFDNPNNLLDHHYEMEPLMDDDAAFLLGLVDGDENPSPLPSNAIKITEFDLNECLKSSIPEPASSERLDTHLASPRVTTLQVGSPLFCKAESPASPVYSDISDIDETAFANPKLHSTYDENSLSPPEVHVSICKSPSSSSSSDEAMTLEDVSAFVRKRKFVSNGEKIPKVKVLLKEFEKDLQPAKARRVRNSRPKDRRDRKKLQNKEAAARYRTKKRMEEKERSGEVSQLVATQKQLKEKHDSLQSEIKYLKSLMCEILQKKGIM